MWVLGDTLFPKHIYQPSSRTGMQYRETGIYALILYLSSDCMATHDCTGARYISDMFHHSSSAYLLLPPAALCAASFEFACLPLS